MTTRDRLLAAAREVVARDRLEGLTLRAIARQAGVSHGAPLRHFPGLATLLAALSAEGFEQLIVAVRAGVEAQDTPGAPQDPASRLARAGRAYVRFAVAEPGVYAVMFRPERSDVTDPAYQAASRASFGQLVDLVAAAQATGWRSGAPSDQVAAVLWASVHGLSDLWLHGALQNVVDDAGLEQLLEVYLGLSA